MKSYHFIAIRIIKIKSLTIPSVGMHEEQRQILKTAYHVFVDRNTLKSSFSVRYKVKDVHMLRPSTSVPSYVF